MKQKKRPPFDSAIPPERFGEMAERDREFHDPVDSALKAHWREGKSPENAWSRAWLANNVCHRRAEAFNEGGNGKHRLVCLHPSLGSRERKVFVLEKFLHGRPDFVFEPLVAGPAPAQGSLYEY